MENKPSSVEWFYETIKNKKIGDGQILIDIDTLLYYFEQAKAMHKEEIEEAWDKRCSYGVVSHSWKIQTKNGEEYYNETYGGNNE